MSAAADATGGRKTGVSTTTASMVREAVRALMRPLAMDSLRRLHLVSVELISITRLDRLVVPTHSL